MLKMTRQLGFTSIDDLCYNHVVGGSSGKDGEGNKHDFAPVPSFTKAYTAYEAVKSFFCPCSITEHEEQDILDLELALFLLRYKASNKQLSVTYFFGRKVIYNL
jgi:hypothetical protein